MGETPHNKPSKVHPTRLDPAELNENMQINGLNNQNLEAWAALRSHLLLSLVGSKLPAHWRVKVILNSLPPFAYMACVTLKNITLTLCKLGITQAVHLQEHSDGTWKSFEAKMDQLRGISPEMQALTAQLLVAIQEATTITVEKVTDPNIWDWSGD